MGAADRHVRHLRLAAPSADAARALLPRLEDGLRCASLPDQGSRVYLVRRLDLGRLARDVTPQTLSLLIENRLAAQGGRWVAGGTAAADQAEHVTFASHLEARIQLALRLVGGTLPDAWYWPLAVPEFRPDQGREGNLACIVRTLVQLPEARVAFPAWLAALHRSAAGVAWLASIENAHGVALLRLAGITMTDAATAPSPAIDGATDVAEGTATSSKDVARRSLPPAWLRRALDLADAPGARAGGAETPYAKWRQPGGETASAIVAPPASTAAKQTAGKRADADAAHPAPADPDLAPRAAPRPSPDRAPAPVATPRPSAAVTAAQSPDASASNPDAPRPEADTPGRAAPYLDPTLDPTCAGGLLFVLPVLARLGLEQWLGDAGVEGEAFTRRVLRVALTRLAVPETDPAWTLGRPMALDERPSSTPAPGSWAAPLLAARAGQVSLAETLSKAASADGQALVWLTAARRWLRRTGRIGLASLILREARLSATPTHCDLHFRLQDSDLRVRRLGLDIDPGWLPWFGRVVSFHYEALRP